MTDLAEFLLERIAEDEAAAWEANGRVAWLTLREPDGSMRYTTVGHQLPGLDHWVADGHEIEAQQVFVFYDSARILAECEAKRRIVEAYRDARAAAESIRDTFAGDDSPRARAERASYGAAETAWWVAMETVALPYADRPDYPPEPLACWEKQLLTGSGDTFLCALPTGHDGPCRPDDD